MSFLQKAGIIAIVIFFGITLFYFLFPPDQQRIKNLVNKGKTGIEEQDILKTMSVVAIDYQDRYGLNNAALRSLFFELFKLAEKITIRCDITELQIRDDTAYVTAVLWAKGIINSEQQDIAGDSRLPAQIRLTIRKREFMWRVVGSEWDDVQQVNRGLFGFSGF